MKKAILKMAVFLVTFLLTLIVTGRIMNKEQDDRTIEMSGASLPIITMENGETRYNQLHGCLDARNVVYQRETLTPMNEGRRVDFSVETYGLHIANLSYELRNVEGTRLIEGGDIEDFQVGEGKITAGIAFKDLIEEGKEYSLMIRLTLSDGSEPRYYTRVVWNDGLHFREKLDFVLDFHNKTFDINKASELTKYLETNSKLQKNDNFNTVNIHSSLKQVTYGELDIYEVMDPVITLREIAPMTASLVLDFYVEEEEAGCTYHVTEYYRVRYSSDRMYLLDYERTMNQIPFADRLYANDKFLLGIADSEVEMAESTKGNYLAFEQEGRLFGYDVSDNKLILLYGSSGQPDKRSLNTNQKIKLLRVSDQGDVCFAVYGYLDSGTYEGQTGLVVLSYSAKKNTLEELLFLSTDKSADIVKNQADNLLYVNEENQLYVAFDYAVYQIDLVSREYTRLVDTEVYESLSVSGDQSVAVWSESTSEYHNKSIMIRDLDTGETIRFSAEADEIIKPFGFMNRDIIYGVAKEADITRDKTGHYVFPMYKICICDSEGDLLKEYRQDNLYITGITFQDNQITLERVERRDDSFREVYSDHITNNVEQPSTVNKIVTADIDVYEHYVQIQTKKVIDEKTIKIATPKQVVPEESREVSLPTKEDLRKYYAYNGYGVSGIYDSPATAISKAYSEGGVVVDETGHFVWTKEKLSTRNQIMAIKERTCTEGETSAGVCLDTILQHRGISRNVEEMLESGSSSYEILRDNLDGYTVLDLEGCDLAAVLYYVNMDIPVMALFDSGEAVLITGFNEQNVVIFDPAKGTLAKKGMNDSTQWFEENGNCFLTYLPVAKD